MKDLSIKKAGTIKIGDRVVNRLGFGAMRITGEGIWGEPEDRNECLNVLRHAVELGVNFIDTADAYGPEVSENLIAEALHPYPSGLVIATKGGLVRGGPGDWRPNGTPEHLKEACEASLRRLRLKTIEVYQFHRPDPNVPFETSLDALIDLKKEGKIKHIGLSNVTLDQLKIALKKTEIVSVQNRFNIFHKSDSDNIVKFCEQKGIAFIPYFPLNAGDIDEQHRVLLTSIASACHATVHQVILAWLLAYSPIMLPIPGTKTIKHLEDNVHAAEIQLSEEHLEALNKIS